MPGIVFIDKTIGYVLKNNQLDAGEFVELKRKISTMAKMVFDIPMDSLKSFHGIENMDLNDVRVCIEPRMEQVRTVHESGCRWIKMTINRSLNNEIPAHFREALLEAGRRNMKISVGCINISEKSRDRIDVFQKLVKEFAIHSIIIHDCDSSLDPLATYRILQEMKNRTACNMEYGGKNALGLATGNTLGAIKSGICTVAASVGGIGGFPAFEEVVMGVFHLMKIPVVVPKNIAHCSKEVLESIGVNIPKTKPIIGANIFAHESGIHVDGVIKRSELYEPFTPEEVGLFRKIVIGKHSGKAAIEQKVRELNLNIKPSCVAHLLEKVRALAVRQKAAVVDEQLRQLAKEVSACEGACC
jgi:homocitrate synthase NifV